MESGADYSIVRPALLDGEGGHAAEWLRRLARWPVHPVPMDARGRLAPLDVRDLGAAIAVLCERGGEGRREVELGGSVRRTMAEHLAALRASQGGQPALRLPVPAPLARLAALACDALHATPLCPGTLELMRRDNLPRTNPLRALIGRAPLPVGREPQAGQPAYPRSARTA
jgi:NADH dehydrogenase